MSIIKNCMRTLRFIGVYLVANLQAAMEYRVAFCVQIITMIANDSLWLFFWWIYFRQFPLVHGWQSTNIVVSTVSRFADQTWTQRSRRPSPFGLPGVPSIFQEAMGSGAVRKGRKAGTYPLWTNASPTTFTCMLTCIRAWPGSAGLPSPGFSPTACSRRGRAGASGTIFHARGRWRLDAAWKPVPFAIKRVMHICRGIKVSMCFVVTHRTAKQFSPLDEDTLAFLVREPLAPSPAS